MTSQISEIIKSCEWAESHFLIISENVFSPLLYYSYFGSLIPTLLIGLIVYLSNRKKIENKILFLISISFAFWTLLNLITWATEFPSKTMLAWSILNVVEPVIYFLSFYFVYVMIFDRDFSNKQKVLFSSPLLITILLSSTKFNLIGYDLSNCDRAAVEGVSAIYGYWLDVVYILFIISSFIYFVRKNKDRVLLKKAILITFGTLAFLTSFYLGNILEYFTENWYIGQYGLFGAPIFVGVLAYSMVKYKTFNIRMFGAQVLVVALSIMIFSMLFVRTIENVKYVVITTLILVIIFGYQLVKSVKMVEVQRQNLQKANEQQESLMRFINHQVKGFLTRSRLIFDALKNDEYGKLSPEAKKLVDVGFDTNTQAVQMVKSLLDASNLSDGTVNYQHVNFDFRALVSDIVGQLKSTAEAKGLKLNAEIDSSKEMMVNGDLTHLAQAVRNLIENSIQYTNAGAVTVSLSVTEDKKVLFKVSDTGMGLSEEDKKVLFKQGGRGEEAQRRNVNSTGYGLYITYKIVKDHKGQIKATSAGRDKGSTFEFALPLV